jgi:SAM-dependent methyltransferase
MDNGVVQEDPRQLSVAQQQHWDATYHAHPDMYGLAGSVPGRHALQVFRAHGVRQVVELGSGQGRDTLPFLRAGLDVIALDFSPTGLDAIAAHAAGLEARLDARVHNVTEPLPLPDESADAVYSHMLLSMAFPTDTLIGIAAEIHRVLRPSGWHVFAVRHTGDPHFGGGIDHGDNIYEHGGFAVHYFDQALVDRFAVGMRFVDRFEFQEGDLPRELWCITLRKPNEG